MQAQSHESIGVLHYLSGGAWDPHDRNSMALFCDSSFQCWDLRSMKYVFSIFKIFYFITLFFIQKNPESRTSFAPGESW